MSGERHDTEGNGRLRVSWGQIVVVVTWLVTALLAYGAVDARVRVLEDRYERLFQDLADIKKDVRTLVERRP